LKRKVGEMEATIQSDMKRGRVIEPSVQIALEDALSLQQELAKGAERFFQFGLYVTIPAVTIDELDKITKQVEATLGSLLIITKKAVLAMDDGFRTTLPMGKDRIVVTRNMDTTSLATTFPFTTSELSANEGILYGMNEHNGSLIIFDRFSLENANMVVFGKSLASWEPVLVRKDGVERLEQIGNVVETLIQKHGITHKDDGLEGVANPNLEVFSFGSNLRGGWSKVSLAARKPFSPRENLYKITTKSGRSITVTADHCLVTLKNGTIGATRGQSVAIGEAVPIPRQLPEPTRIPQAVFPKKLVPTWPDHLPSVLKLDVPLLTLLGFTASEGLINQPVLTIYNIDKDVLALISSSATLVGATTTPRRASGSTQIKGYAIGPNAWAKLFVALGAGGSSGTKRVPPTLLTATNDQVSAYLRAYYEGDGTVSSKEVSCTSKSSVLIGDLAYLLLRFGIVGRIREKHKRATNSNSPPGTYWELVISGATNVESFAQHIGFLTKTKSQKLTKLREKKGNTNVDTVPTLSPLLNKLYTMLYRGDGVRAPANFSPLKRGIFSPSREELTHIIMAVEARIKKLQAIRQNVAFLTRLPSLETIVARGRKQHFNRLLWRELGYSWQLMKTRAVVPGTINVLRAYQTISGETIDLPDVKRVLYETYKETGVSLLDHNKSLWTSIVLEARNQGDTAYPTLYDAVMTIKKRYRSIQATIHHAKRIIEKLRLLVNADLFWDPIVAVEKINHHERHVYDLAVDSGVFLGGHGGMFIHNSGGGKSYMVKLEIMRALMFDTEVIVIDPENEYAALTHAMGGEYIRFHFGTTTKINPFDLAILHQKESREAGSRSAGESELNQKILSLHGFFRVVMGKLTPTEDAILDRALILTYKQKGITPDPQTQGKEPPLMEDLYKALIGMEESPAKGLADRIEKFVKGSLVGIFDQQTNVEIRNALTVFSIRDLEEELRPIAMYLILDFIWTKVRRNLKRRMLVVDEAWYMMKFPDSAQFMNSIAKRARKYYLGVTTITQDVEDFLSTDLGKAIIQNSSLQILLKQSPSAIDKVADTFYLSEGEKHLLLSADIGEGLFFAGPAHAAIRIIASPEEHELATTKPQDALDKALATRGRQEAAVNQVARDESTLQPAGRTLPISNRPIFTVETVSGGKS
ncbi:MAG: LAGLIDADG family homing endonuclease, partial [Patescibacteria group bacterium]